MQRLINFGSYLQAWGLKHIIESLGHSVEFIDVRLNDGSFMNLNTEPLQENIAKKIIRRILKGEQYCLKIQRENRFRSEYFPMLGLKETPNENTHYDAVVIGSDEVFSYCQFVKWGGTSMFFGENVEAPRIISYAGSFGYTTIEKLKKINMDETVTKWLYNFNSISVRDQNSYNLVVTLTGKKPVISLDPVLVYEFDKEIIEPNERNYILIYGYDNRLCEQKYVEQIRNFARKYKKKLYSVGFFQNWCDKQIDATPFEVLGYVKNADYVVCETFHGTIFSIKYQKQFATVVRESNENKLGDLLQRFGLGKRTFTGNEDLESILLTRYDKSAIQSIILDERRKAYEYLKNNL